ncbi:DMT family transporter [Sphingomonas lenta]|uniref:EamA family transporter n=1 Tax=Sphingomonas lenta TaxID=1141887 RepID=A0A2A2SG62_9SPHN|nr:EamA family transporter [Sphingomonas lenta]PAX08001.1 EamA family transporter [Sphingomonas lenta]
MSGDTRPNSTRLSILLPFFVVVLIWGSTWIVIADQIGTVPPQWSVAYRFIVAGLAMAAVAWWRGDRWPTDARGLSFAAVLGLFQFCLNFNFVYQAERFVTSGLVAVVFALMLVPNALLGRVFLGQRLGRQLLLGSAVAVCGIALLFVHEARVDPNGPGQVMLGVGLTLLGVLSASITNVMQGSATAKAYPMASMLAAGMLIGAAIDAGAAFALAGPPSWDPRPGYLLGVLYLGVFASAVAFTLYFNIIRVIGPAKAAYNSVVVPVIAMLFSTVFEGYRWSALAAAGGLLAGVGLVIALTARRPNR